MLVTTTMLLGFVGLIAIASSDSLRGRWLTSTFVGTPLAAAAPVGASASKPTRIKKTGALSRRMPITPLLRWPRQAESIAARSGAQPSSFREGATLPETRRLEWSVQGRDAQGERHHE